jgi:hypothetical protein
VTTPEPAKRGDLSEYFFTADNGHIMLHFRDSQPLDPEDNEAEDVAYVPERDASLDEVVKQALEHRRLILSLRRKRRRY